MTPSPGCEQARALVGEVALGIASGEERARVLAHVVRCSDCRQLVSETAEIVDELLVLAPEAEPPTGFESSTLARIRRRRPRWVWRAVAAMVLAGAVTGAVVLFATRADRELAQGYRRTLREAEGTYFGVRSLIGPDGREAGDIFVYAGRRPWLVVVLDDEFPVGPYRGELVTSGGRVDLGYFEVSERERTWGHGLEVDLRALSSARIVSVETGAEYVADFARH